MQINLATAAESYNIACGALLAVLE